MISEWILSWKSNLPWFHDQCVFHIFWVDWLKIGDEKRMQMEKRILSGFWYWIISQFDFFNCRDPVLIPLPCIAWIWTWPKPSSPQDPVIYIIRSGAAGFLQQQRWTLDMNHEILIDLFRDPSNGWWKIPLKPGRKTPLYIQHLTRVNGSLLTSKGRIINWTPSPDFGRETSIRKPHHGGCFVQPLPWCPFSEKYVSRVVRKVGLWVWNMWLEAHKDFSTR